MSDRDKFGFCPKCGALTQNGICQSCGYGRYFGALSNQENRQEYTYSESGTKQKKSSGKKILIGICIGLAVLFILAMLLFFAASMHMSLGQSSMEVIPGYGNYDGSFGYGDPYADNWNYDDSYDSYVPHESDDYYEEITDATSTDLSYGVIWNSVSMRPDDPEDGHSYDCVYPVLIGGENEPYAAINKKIEEMACVYKDTYRDYDLGVVSYGYVTYMDEAKLSVVVQHRLNDGGTVMPIVRALTFYVDTGEVMRHDEMITIDEELVWQFRSRNTYQNGTIEFVDGLSDDELRRYLEDEENSIVFYTPVGLEAGFNYDNGWVTVTLKNTSV